MIKKLLFLLSFLLVRVTYAQKTNPTILKSTITSVGSTSVYPVFNSKKNYEIQQSIGQSSIIGKKTTGKTTVQQGFLNHVKIFTINNSDLEIIDESLNLVISPNPFIDHIKINFTRETKHNIHIFIYDTNGKVLFSKNYNPTDSIHIPMKYYTIGTYLIRIQSGKDKFTRKILKTE
ncbi:T9SS type A sorting domain-containing protein [Polaribacter staleyi]|uniref:T9SS type A sorting domain-containing protein n=1 Tax=Polaribacter staleyi TaxID=2022337 RepID=UPI0031BABEC3